MHIGANHHAGSPPVPLQDISPNFQREIWKVKSKQQHCHLKYAILAHGSTGYFRPITWVAHAMCVITELCNDNTDWLTAKSWKRMFGIVCVNMNDHLWCKQKWLHSSDNHVFSILYAWKEKFNVPLLCFHAMCNVDVCECKRSAKLWSRKCKINTVIVS